MEPLINIFDAPSNPSAFAGLGLQKSNKTGEHYRYRLDSLVSPALFITCLPALGNRYCLPLRGSTLIFGIATDTSSLAVIKTQVSTNKTIEGSVWRYSLQPQCVIGSYFKYLTPKEALVVSIELLLTFISIDSS